ncbi:MAG: 50S ribosomal protein L39e [Nanoarchaeota archaeon]|nr:50S ribosomal protein L39e [Nanoarchaeota archaeon]MBU1103961.1 50S ribosomal protein L39e [Nanoarchaeota archaeon]
MKHQQKKIKLNVANRQTRWAPFWAVIKKFGMGHKTHPSAITKHRRHWRRTKLKIKPRRMKKQQLG